MVEGPIHAGCRDHREHALEITQDVAGWNPESVKASFPKGSITLEVALRVVAHRMCFPVHLDRQPAFETGEVRNITAARELPPKAKSARALAEMMPQYDFREGHLAAKVPRAANVGVGRTDHTMPNANAFGPSTMLRMVPLPVPGRI